MASFFECRFQALEKVKLIQVERYHNTRDEIERSRIECDPMKIFHSAIKNVTPVFRLMNYIKGGTIYQVFNMPQTVTHLFINRFIFRLLCAHFSGGQALTILLKMH